MQRPYRLLWLRGIDCDGCTIAALGDTSAPAANLLLNELGPGLPSIDLIHPGFAVDAGATFMEQYQACARGDAGPFAVLVESAIPDDEATAGGWYGTLGEEDGVPLTVATWLDRLAPAADFVVAIGDCAVWGGPHAIGNNPTGSAGVSSHLGVEYRSRLGAPVINMPGCSVPAGLSAILTDLVRWSTGAGPLPALDAHHRPVAIYGRVWKGALALWEA